MKYELLKCHYDSDESQKKQSDLSDLKLRLIRPFISRNDSISSFLVLISFIILFSGIQINAQSTRGLVNDGVDLYKEKNLLMQKLISKKELRNLRKVLKRSSILVMLITSRKDTMMRSSRSNLRL